MRDGKWKLIGTDGKQNYQLVNLADEKPETINHAKDKPELVKRLLKSHLDWYTGVQPSHPTNSN